MTERASRILELPVYSDTPEYYKSHLVSEALGAIRGVLKLHPQIDIHTRSVDPARLYKLQHSETVESFESAWLDAFGDDSLHIVNRAKEDLRRNLTAALIGHDDGDVRDFSEDNNLIVHVEDTRTVAEAIVDFLAVEFSHEEESTAILTS